MKISNKTCGGRYAKIRAFYLIPPIQQKAAFLSSEQPLCNSITPTWYLLIYTFIYIYIYVYVLVYPLLGCELLDSRLVC